MEITMENVFKLDDVTFPLLMKDTIDSQFTGIIFVSSGQWKKGLIFKDGLLCAIQSNKTEELLGNIMVSIGSITEEENNQSLELSALREENRE